MFAHIQHQLLTGTAIMNTWSGTFFVIRPSLVDRPGHAAVTCLHQSRVEGDEQRWTVRQQHQHLQSLDREFRSSHVTVPSGILVHQQCSKFIQLFPLPKKIWHLIPLLPCQQLQSFHVSARLMVTIYMTSVFSARESRRREPLRGRLSGSSVSELLSATTDSSSETELSCISNNWIQIFSQLRQALTCSLTRSGNCVHRVESGPWTAVGLVRVSSGESSLEKKHKGYDKLELAGAYQ